MQVFFEARQRYAIELRPREILDGLHASDLFADLPTEDALDYHLSQLVAWGNLAAAHDPGAVTRLEDFYRKRFLYHLTAAGPAPSPEALLRLLHDLHSAFDTLTEEANRFIGELDRSTAPDRLEEEWFVLYKQALLATSRASWSSCAGSPTRSALASKPWSAWERSG